MIYPIFKALMLEKLNKLFYSNQPLNLNELSQLPVFFGYLPYGKVEATLQFTIFQNILLVPNNSDQPHLITPSQTFTFYPSFFNSFISEEVEVKFEEIKNHLVAFIFDEFNLERFCIRWEDSNIRIRTSNCYLGEASEDFLVQVDREKFSFNELLDQLSKTANNKEIFSQLNQIKVRNQRSPLKWYQHPNFAMAYNETGELFRIMEKQEVNYFEKLPHGYSFLPANDVIIDWNASPSYSEEIKTFFESQAEFPPYYQSLIYYAMAISSQFNTNSRLFNLKIKFFHELPNF
jgi:hypothetical protein